MKPTKQIIEEMEKKFRGTKFAKGGGLCFECCDYEGMWDDLEDFINSYTRTLLTAFAEEVIGTPIDAGSFKDNKPDLNKLEHIATGITMTNYQQRLKAKEIIKSLGK